MGKATILNQLGLGGLDNASGCRKTDEYPDRLSVKILNYNIYRYRKLERSLANFCHHVAPGPLLARQCSGRHLCVITDVLSCAIGLIYSRCAIGFNAM